MEMGSEGNTSMLLPLSPGNSKEETFFLSLVPWSPRPQRHLSEQKQLQTRADVDVARRERTIPYVCLQHRAFGIFHSLTLWLIITGTIIAGS